MLRVDSGCSCLRTYAAPSSRCNTERMFRHPLPLATSNLRGVHSRKQPRAGKRSSKTQNRQGELTRSEGGRLVPFQTSNSPKNELGQRHREPPNPPRNLPTLQTQNQPISPAPTECQRRAANSDMGAGGLLGRKKGPAGTRGAGEAPRQLRRQRWAKRPDQAAPPGQFQPPHPR